MSEEFDKVSLKNFASNEVIAVMQNLMKEALKQDVETIEALNNIELLVNTEIIQTDDLIENFKTAFVTYLKDRRNAYAKYLAKEANAKFADAYALVINLFASGDLQKNMSIEAIKAVLDANVLNVSFYDGNKEEKQEEKPKVSEQSKKQSVDELNALVKELGANKEAPYTRVQVSLVDPNANPVLIMPSGVAFGYFQMNDNATAEEMMALVLQYERFVLMAKELGATYGIAEHRNRQVPQQQYGDVERNYTPPANEKPAQAKGNHAPNNTQQEVPAQGALTREVVAIEIVQAKTEKKTIGYKPLYMSDNNGKQERKQIAATGLWSSKANNTLLKILHEQGVDLTPFKVGMVIPLDTPIICEYIQKPHFSNPEQKVNEVVGYRKAGQ